MNIEFPSGNGMYDIRHKLKADGQPNTNVNAGKNYDPLTKDEFFDLVQNPDERESKDGRWFIPSYGTHSESRRKPHQLDSGWFYAITVDLDDGNLDKDAVIHLMRQVVPGVGFWLFSTRSAKPNKKKWRVVFFLLQAIEGEYYQRHCMALYLAIDKMLQDWQAQGFVQTSKAATSADPNPKVEVDKAPAQPQQISFLPNRGEFYEYHIEDGDFLWFDNFQDQLNQLAQAAAFKGPKKDSPDDSAIFWFNRQFAIEDMLEWCGYDHNGRSWRSPYQRNSGSSNFSTDIKYYADGVIGFVSQSGSDKAVHPFGAKRADTGGCPNGDAFALFRHYFFAEEQKDAIAEIDLWKRDSGGPFCTNGSPHMQTAKAARAHGRSLWEGYQKAMAEVHENDAEIAVEYLKQKESALDSTQEYQWDIEKPAGLWFNYLVERLYHDSARPVWQYAHAFAYGMVSGLFANHYHWDSEGLSTYFIIAGDSATGKGSVLRVGRKIIDALEAHDSVANKPELRIKMDNEPGASDRGIRQMFDGDHQSRYSYLEDSDSWFDMLMQSSVGSNGQKIRSALTSFWDKSGIYGATGRVAYAKDVDNVDSIRGPNLSLNFDTQMDPLKRLMGTPTAMLGFMQRFNVVMYEGPAVKARRGRSKPACPDLVNALAAAYKFVSSLQPGQRIEITGDEDVYTAIDDMADEWVAKKQRKELGADIGNRAHAQVMKMMCLQAILDNPEAPYVTMAHFNSARNFAEKGFLRSQEMIANGEVGSGESVRLSELKRIIQDYATMKPSTRASYRQPQQLQELDDVIAESFFIKRLRRSGAFKGSDTHRTTDDIIRSTLAEAVKQDAVRIINRQELGTQKGVMLKANVTQTLYQVKEGIEGL